MGIAYFKLSAQIKSRQSETLHTHIDILVIDGPPAETQPQSRYPAYPVLRPQMSGTAVILLDDSGREDEREAVRRWCAADPDLKEFGFADS